MSHTSKAVIAAASMRYRIRWEPADLSGAVAGFRGQHTGTGNDDGSWTVLQSVIARLRDCVR